jgi:hypothetical protein
MTGDADGKRVTATVELGRAGEPRELHVKFRLPAQHTLQKVTVNGEIAKIGGVHNDTAVFASIGKQHFDLIAEFS